jgi:hypothetical protein
MYCASSENVTPRELCLAPAILAGFGELLLIGVDGGHHRVWRRGDLHADSPR